MPEYTGIWCCVEGLRWYCRAYPKLNIKKQLLLKLIVDRSAIGCRVINHENRSSLRPQIPLEQADIVE